MEDCPFMLVVSADMLSSIVRRDIGSGQMGHELSFTLPNLVYLAPIL